MGRYWSVRIYKMRKKQADQHSTRLTYNGHPSDSTCAMCRHGVEGDGNGNESSSCQEDHEKGVGDGEKLSAPFTGEDEADTVHGINFRMLALELTDDVAGPSSHKTKDDDD